MTVLDKIGKMKKEGLDDAQISRRLQEEGVPPREIDEALDQSQVKSAVSNYEEIPANGGPTAPYPTFQPQIAEHQNNNELEEPAIAIGNPQYPQGYAPEQQYDQQYPEYQNAEPIDTEMISEITEQILDEKTREMQKDLSELVKFKIEIQGKVNNVEDRLKRIELTIDKLQTSIIGSIGNYGKNISDLKKEMHATQDSFSKIVNPLAENLKELRNITKGIDAKTKKKPTKI